jgi:hypothetical protein
VGAQRWEIHRTRLTGERAPAGSAPHLYGAHGECRIVCGDGAILRLLAAADARGPLDLRKFAASRAQQPLALT